MGKDDDDTNGLSRITGGLGDLINLLVTLDKNGDLPKSGRREKDGLVVEYSIGKGRMGRRGAGPTPPPEETKPATVERRPNQRTAKSTEIELVEPVTDMFDEPHELVLLFELPGVSRPDIRCLLDGDILLLEAKTERRLYRKEMLIETSLADGPPTLNLHNGVLEVRLKKQA